MRPLFNKDLTCTPEEIQGVMYYNVVDPKTQRIFQLYEIEYLIAGKMDGVRSIGDIIAAVKADLNFDISDADLRKFIAQLESLNFVKWVEETVVRPTVELRPKKKEEDIGPIKDVTRIHRPNTEDEVKRNLTSAFTLIKKGQVQKARDFLMAARKAGARDETRVIQLLTHVEVLGDDFGPPEVTQLYSQAKELFPEITANIDASAFASSQSGTGPPLFDPMPESIDQIRQNSLTPDFSEFSDPPLEDDADLSEFENASKKRKVLIALAMLLLLVGGGLFFAMRSRGLWRPAPLVKVATVAAERFAVYYVEPATKVFPADEVELHFESAGRLSSEMLVTSGRVTEGDILASLLLPPRVVQNFKTVKQRVETLSSQQRAVAVQLEQLQKERTLVLAERQAAEKRLHELQPQGLKKAAPRAKQEIDKLKAARVRANKKLSQIATKERGPRQSEVSLRKKYQQAVQQLRKFETTMAPRLIRAPFNGEVTQVLGSVGTFFKMGQAAMRFRNPSVSGILFKVQQPVTFSTGGEVLMTIEGAPAIIGKIASTSVNNKLTEVSVIVPDPVGALLQTAPEKIHLQRDVVNDAFKIPLTALVTNKVGTQVVQLKNNRIMRRPVEVLQRGANYAVVRDPSGTTKINLTLVVARLKSSAGIASLRDGTKVEISGQR